MAKKLKTDAKINLDDLDIPDFEFDFAEPKDDRHPVTKFASGVYKGAKSTLASSDTVKRSVLTSLPETYGQTYNELNRTVTKAKGLVNESLKSVQPQVGEFARAVDKVLPAQMTRTKATMGKLGNWGAKKKTDAFDKESAREDGIAIILKQIEEGSRSSAEDNLKRTALADAKDRVREGTDAARHKDQLTSLNLIAENTNKLAMYQDKVGVGYQRKSLEVQLRSYYVLADILESNREDNAKLLESMSVVVKNTALPDFLKLNKTENVSQITRNKFIDSFSGGLLGDKLDYGKKVGDLIQKKVKEQVTSIRDVLWEATNAIDSAQGTGIDAVGTAGELAGGVGVNELLRPLTKRIRALANKNSKVGEYGARAHNLIMNKAETANSLRGKRFTVGENDGFVKETIYSALNWSMENLVPSTKPVIKIEKGNYLDNDNPGIWTRQSVRSVNEIIPGLLSRILREVYISRTGDTSAGLTSYDFKKNAFVDAKQKKESISALAGTGSRKYEKTATRDEYTENFADNTRETIDIIANGQKLDPKVKLALSKFLTSEAINGNEVSLKRLGNEDVLKHDRFAAPHAKEISRLFKNYYGADSHLDKKEDYGIKNKGILDKRARVKAAIDFDPAEIQAAWNMGDGEALLESGIIDEDGQVNFETIIELIHKGVSFDEPPPGTIPAPGTKPIPGSGGTMSPDKARAAVNPRNRKNRARIDRPVSRKETTAFVTPGKSTPQPTPTAAKPFSSSGGGMLSKQRGHLYMGDSNQRPLGESAQGMFDALKQFFTPKKNSEDKPNVASGESKSAGPEEKDTLVSLVAQSNEHLKELIELQRAGVAVNAGYYQSTHTGDPKAFVTSLKTLPGDLLNKGLSGLGGAIKGAGRFARNTVNFQASMIGKGFGLARDISGNVASGLMGLTNGFAKFKDVYLPGVVDPIMTGAKLKAGKYLDRDTGKIITSWRQLRGTVIDSETGEVVFTKDDLDKILIKVKGKFKPVAGVFNLSLGVARKGFEYGKEIFKANFSLLSTGLDIAKSTFKGAVNTATFLLDRPIDIYVKGQMDKPVIYAHLMRDGYYRLAAQLDKVISRPSQLTGPVMYVGKDAPEYVVTEEQYKIGLVDSLGRPLDTIGGKLFKKTKAIIGAGKQMAGMAIDAGLGAIQGVGNFFKGLSPNLLSNNSFDIAGGGGKRIAVKQYNVLVDIRDLINERLPGVKSQFTDKKMEEVAGSSGGVIKSIKDKTSIVVEKLKNLSLIDAAKQGIDTGVTTVTDSKILKRVLDAKKKYQQTFKKEKSKALALVTNTERKEKNKALIQKARDKIGGLFKRKDDDKDGKGGLGLVGKGLAGLTGLIGGLFKKKKKGEDGEDEGESNNGLMAGAGAAGAAGLAWLKKKLFGNGKAAATAAASVGSKAAGAKAADKGVAYGAGKFIGKNLGKSASKKIPILGALAGLGFAGKRAFDGDFSGAGLEALSGLAGSTGLGIPVSLALDAYLAKRDYDKEQGGMLAADAAKGAVKHPGAAGALAGGAAVAGAGALRGASKVAGAAAGRGILGTAMRYVLPAASVSTGVMDAFNTDTADYYKRFGMDQSNTGVLRDTFARTMGVGSDIINRGVGLLSFGMINMGKGFSDRKHNPLATLRYVQYGFSANDMSHYSKIVEAEEIAAKVTGITPNGFVKTDYKKLDIAALARVFDVSEQDQERLQMFMAWYKERFSPVYANCLRAMQKTAKGKTLRDTNDLNDKEKRVYLENAKYLNGPYGVVSSPIAGTDRLPSGVNEVKVAYQAALAWLGAEPKKQTEAERIVEKDPLYKAAALNATIGKGAEAALIDPSKLTAREREITDSLKTAIQQDADKAITSISGIAATKMSAMKVTPLEAVRFKTYGINNLELVKVNLFRSLEKQAIGKVKYSASGVATWEGSVVTVIDTMGKDFGVSTVASPHSKEFSKWYVKRFIPTFLNYLNLYKAHTGRELTTNLLLLSEYSLKGDQLAYIATQITNTPGVWDIIAAPWPDFKIGTDASICDNNIALLKQGQKPLTMHDPGHSQRSPETKGGVFNGSDSQQKKDKALSDSLQREGKAPQSTSPDSESGKDYGGSTKVTSNSTSALGGSRAPSKIPMAGGPVADGSNAAQYIKTAGNISLKGVNPQLLANFYGMVEEYGKKTGNQVTVTGGFRSYEQQKKLFETMPAGRAAPPGRSLHEFGLALDVSRGDLNAMEELGLMKKYGFTRPVGGEPWHLEPAGIQPDIGKFRTDPVAATEAIRNSIGRGGGGYGTVENAAKYRRDTALAMSLLNAPADASAEQTAKDMTLPGENYASAPGKLLDDKPKTQGESSGTIAPAGASGGDVSGKPPASTGGGGEGGSVLSAGAGPGTYAGSTGKDPVSDFAEARPKIDSTSAPKGSPVDGVAGGRGWGGMKDSIIQAADKVGVDKPALISIAAKESGFDPNAKGSGQAMGLYQFLPDTWSDMLRKFGRKYGLGTDASRSDPQASALMGAEYVKENTKIISSVKSDVNSTDLYMAHFLGPYGAKKFLKLLQENPNAIGAENFQKAAASNKNIFYSDGRPLTVSEIYNKIGSDLAKRMKDFGVDNQFIMDGGTKEVGGKGTMSTSTSGSDMGSPAPTRTSATSDAVGSPQSGNITNIDTASSGKVDYSVTSPTTASGGFDGYSSPTSASALPAPSLSGRGEAVQDLSVFGKVSKDIYNVLVDSRDIQQKMLDTLITVSKMGGLSQAKEAEQESTATNSSTNSPTPTARSGPTSSANMDKVAVSMRRKY